MNICCDFDGTVVEQRHDYADLRTPLKLVPGARDALRALRRAGHTLVLSSGRANRAKRFDPELDPLGPRFPDDAARLRYLALNQARYQQMVDFVAATLPGVFAYVDDGAQGKVTADLYIDDKAVALEGGERGWGRIARTWGE